MSSRKVTARSRGMNDSLLCPTLPVQSCPEHSLTVNEKQLKRRSSHSILQLLQDFRSLRDTCYVLLVLLRELGKNAEQKSVGSPDGPRQTTARVTLPSPCLDCQPHLSPFPRLVTSRQVTAWSSASCSPPFIIHPKSEDQFCAQFCVRLWGYKDK